MGAVDLGWAAAVRPAEPAFFGDDGARFAAADHPVILAAKEGGLVRVGAAAASPLAWVMDLAVIPGLEAIGPRAATVAGVADQPLIGGGDALLSTQVQWSLRVVVEHRQVVNALGGHGDQVAHRQPGTAA